MPPAGQPQEACYRAACGRAYYAAFVISRDALLGGGFRIPRSGEAHGEVIKLMKSSSNADVRAAGSSLDQLRVTRQSADYEIGRIPVSGMPFTQLRAVAAIGLADEIIAAVGKARTADRRLYIDP